MAVQRGFNLNNDIGEERVDISQVKEKSEYFTW